jgi:quinol monooxygenase YgiN
MNPIIHPGHRRSRRMSFGAALMLGALVAGTPLANAHDGTHIAYSKFPPGAIAVVAEVRAKPGKEDELRAATLPLIKMVRNEPNNLVYFLHENRGAPGHFIFYEVFATEADFEAHNATSHVKAWFGKLPDLADGRVEVMRMSIQR